MIHLIGLSMNNMYFTMILFIDVLFFFAIIMLNLKWQNRSLSREFFIQRVPK